MKKDNKLPLYILFALVGVALVWRIANPPAARLPGPVGQFPGWKSVATLGVMSSQAVNPSGTMWAGAWNETLATGQTRSAVRIIDFNDYSTKACAMPDGVKVDCLSWADDNTVRAFCIGSKMEGQVVYVDVAAGKKHSEVGLNRRITRVIAWPATSDNPAVVLDETDKQMQLAVVSTSGKQIVGTVISFDMPKDSGPAPGAGVAADGASFVFSISDPAAKDGRSCYLADTRTGTTKKMFDLGDVPGRIEGIWPSAAGVLMVCNVKDKLEDVVFDPATGKLSEQRGGVVDLGKWPGAPKSIALTSYDGGFEFDLATGKTKMVFDLTKKTSQPDKLWRDMIRESRFYRLKSGGFVTVSETSGAIDIRELRADGAWYRNLLPRM